MVRETKPKKLFDWFEDVMEATKMCEFIRQFMAPEIEEARRQAMSEGREEGRAEGRAEGREEGRAEGRE